MVSIFLKNVRILADPSATDPQPQDLVVRNGVIAAIGRELRPERGMEILEFPNAWVSPGWVDIGAAVCDPGYEHREDLFSASAAGAAGGFTTIACQPNTLPAVHSKAEVLYIRHKSETLPVRFLPIGAVSQDCEGKDLAELYDMHAAGAVAFSDGIKSLQDGGLLLRALLYTQAFGGLVMNRPHHKTIASGGQMHEGRISTMLGMKGIPALAEEIVIQRDLSLLNYAGGRLHFHLVSTVESVNMLRKAKKDGLNISASVAVANLFFTDEKLMDFDSIYKVNPPLRSPADREALLQGLSDGTLDCLCSNHQPWDPEAKNLEFPYAEFGMAGLETAFAVSRTALEGRLDMAGLVDKWAFAPRRILGLPASGVRVGEPADLTVFDPDAEWTPAWNDMRSKSQNTPFPGIRLRGKVLGILNKGQDVWNP